MKYCKLGALTADIGPGPDNPRNSEGTFAVLPGGEILFVYSRFRGDSWADEAFADLALMRSADGGRTWRDEGVILTCGGEGGVNMMCPSLLPMENGDVGLFYLVRLTYTRTRIFLRRSSDGGRSWGDRVACTDQEDFFVINNDRAVRLSGGRIILPAASHRAGEGFMDSRAAVVFFCSDDDGRTWRAADAKCSMPVSSCCRSGLQEPGVLELRPGVLQCWARTDLGRQYEMFSMDGGESWTACQPSRFTSPNSPLSMKRDANGAIYAVWNPIPNYNGRFSEEEAAVHGRYPLAIAVSRDNGRTFSHPAAFEWDEGRGYCYCAMCFTEDALLLAYCAGKNREDTHCLNRTWIRRIERAELSGI